jgi:hypothetical protein
MSVKRAANYELYNTKDVPVGDCGLLSGTLKYRPGRNAKKHKIWIVDLRVENRTRGLPQRNMNTNTIQRCSVIWLQKLEQTGKILAW